METMLLNSSEKIFTDRLHTYSYSAYMDLMHDLAQSGGTTGEQTEGHIFFTKLNSQRMDRVNKTWQVIPEVIALSKTYTPDVYFLVISESWCGDAAPNVATVALMAQQLGIDMKIILRDENPEIMDLFLTHGTRSIPKVIFVDASTHTPLASWGPRQVPAAELVHTARHNGVHADIWKADVQKWYNQDKGVTLQKEILAILQQIADKRHVQFSEN